MNELEQFIFNNLNELINTQLIKLEEGKIILLNTELSRENRPLFQTFVRYINKLLGQKYFFYIITVYPSHLDIESFGYTKNSTHYIYRINTSTYEQLKLCLI